MAFRAADMNLMSCADWKRTADESYSERSHGTRVALPPPLTYENVNDTPRGFQDFTLL
jgi:hypothetical protein